MPNDECFKIVNYTCIGDLPKKSYYPFNYEDIR